jgi:hypothetical protein
MYHAIYTLFKKVLIPLCILYKCFWRTFYIYAKLGLVWPNTHQCIRWRKFVLSFHFDESWLTILNGFWKKKVKNLCLLHFFSFSPQPPLFPSFFFFFLVNPPFFLPIFVYFLFLNICFFFLFFFWVCFYSYATTNF